MKKIDHFGVRTWIEVDTSALKHNVGEFRKLIPATCKIMAIAKSNAYGHGLYDYALAMEKFKSNRFGACPVQETPAGVDWYGVDSITEALTLRKKGIKKPILILGYTLPEWLEDALNKDVSLTVATFESLKDLSRLNFKKKFKIHLKIDTGMHRQGFLPDQINQLIKKLTRMDNIAVEGIYTHFAAAYYPNDRTYTEKQINEFNDAAKKINRAGFQPIRHACATAGALIYPEAHFDMVRIGIGLMGLWPASSLRHPRAGEAMTRGSRQTEIPDLKLTVGNDRHENIELRPILSWRTIVTEVKNLPAGSQIGYDLTEKLKKDSKIAICPIGYWQGFPRSLSGKGELLVCGKRCRVLGRVCMDMIMIDVSEVPNIKVGDIATIIGRDGEEEITAYEIAKQADYSYYEIITRLNPLIKKIYV